LSEYRREVTTVELIRQTLLYALITTLPLLIGCPGRPPTPNQAGTPPTPNEEVQQRFYTPECRQMQEKLATDQNLAPTQTAEITRNMEKAGCGRRLTVEKVSKNKD
jgi:hypothetical protein